MYCCSELGNMIAHHIKLMDSYLMDYCYMIVGSELVDFVSGIDDRIMMLCFLGLFGFIRMFVIVLIGRLGCRLCFGVSGVLVVLRMLNLYVGYG